MGTRVQRIQHPSQLTALTVWRLIPWFAPSRVEIDAQRLSAERVHAWEKELRTLQSACGCDQGAVAMMVGVVSYALYLVLRSGGWGHPGRREFWIGVAVVAVTSSVGKFLGLWLAQRKLDLVIREIQSQWRPDSSPSDGSSYTARQRTESRTNKAGCCGGR